MPSSTFSSRKALIAFAIVFAALLAPYEALVRAAERRWGVAPARIAPRRTGTPHLEMFLEDHAAGIEYDVVAAGTSRVANGVRPESLGALPGRAYNLGIAGGSAIPTLEFLDGLGARPRLLIVGVSPMDLTTGGVRRGERVVARRAPGTADDGELAPTRWARGAVRAALHSARPERRRNLGQWLELRRDGGELLAFLNNEEATAKPSLRQTNGYSPLARVIEPARLGDGQWSGLPDEYAAGRATLPARLTRVIARFRARGTDVALVRLPTIAAVRRSEDAQTTFDADMRELARASGVAYVDGAELAGAEFLAARANFADPEHMNETGASRFSELLAAELRGLTAGPAPKFAGAPSPDTRR